MRANALLVLVALCACDTTPPPATTPRPPPTTCAECPECTITELAAPVPADGMTEIVARPLRPDGLTHPGPCGVLVSWAETIVEVRSVEPPGGTTPEHLFLRLMCPPPMRWDCVRVRVPTARYQDAVAQSVGIDFMLQVTDAPITWEPCPPP